MYDYDEISMACFVPGTELRGRLQCCDINLDMVWCGVMLTSSGAGSLPCLVYTAVVYAL